MAFRSRRGRKMGCLAVARVLQAYLDGEIDEATTRRVSAHLEHCRRCGMKAATYRAIKTSLARSGEGWDELTRRRLEDFAHRVGQGQAGGT